jgi:hypothetical protein
LTAGFRFARVPRELPAGLLRLLVYVLHPEMVEGFTNHVMKVSRFGRPKANDMVVAHITLRSWSLSSTGLPPEDDRVERDVIELPPHLKGTLDRVLRKGGPQDTPSHLPTIELRVSSLGISTNQFGDFSKCSVISDLVPQNDLEALGGTMQGIWDNFIHQPQTGRFLLFSVILGLLCEGLAREHRQLRNGFIEKMNLNRLFVSLPTP